MLEHKSIFEQQWWYHAATDGQWQSAEYSDGQSVRAKMVFVNRKRHGVRTISMPELARVMQPSLQISARKDGERLSQKIRALKGLSDALPNADRFTYMLPPDSDLDLAYSLCDYSAKANYTFRSDPEFKSDPWAEMDQKVRYNIRTGSKRMAVECHGDIDRYIRLAREFIGGRAIRSSVDYDAISRVWDACYARGQATIMSTVDGAGRELASAILIWDEQFLYYWLNCRNPKAGDYTANSVLIWNAIQFANTAGLTFDIDGYAKPHAGAFLSRFGLSPHRRFEIFRTSSAAQLKAASSSYLIDMMGPRIRQRLLNFKNVVSAKRRHNEPSQSHPGGAGGGLRRRYTSTIGTERGGTTQSSP